VALALCVVQSAAVGDDATWQTFDGPTIEMKGLTSSEDGTLWLITDVGVYRWRPNVGIGWELLDRFPEGDVPWRVASSDGVVYACSPEGVYVFMGITWRDVGYEGAYMPYHIATSGGAAYVNGFNPRASAHSDVDLAGVADVYSPDTQEWTRVLELPVKTDPARDMIEAFLEHDGALYVSDRERVRRRPVEGGQWEDVTPALYVEQEPTRRGFQFHLRALGKALYLYSNTAMHRREGETWRRIERPPRTRTVYGEAGQGDTVCLYTNIVNDGETTGYGIFVGRSPTDASDWRQVREVERLDTLYMTMTQGILYVADRRERRVWRVKLP